MRLDRRLGVIAVAVLLLPALVIAQPPETYSSEIVTWDGEEGGFGPPVSIDKMEMFWQPQYNSVSLGNIVENTDGYNNNRAYRNDTIAITGDAAEYVFFKWLDGDDPDAWVRLTSFNGPTRPNPSLHTDGWVEFKLFNRSEFTRSIGVCLGIRETGVAVPMLADGGDSGPLEWVGTDTTPNAIMAGDDGIVDTTAQGDDVQLYSVGTDIVNGEGLSSKTAVIGPGTNGVIDTTPANDDALRIGFRLDADGGEMPIPQVEIPWGVHYVTLRFDLETGNVWVAEYPDYTFVNMGGGIAPFTGNGTLSDVDPPRGTLGHLAIVNVPGDPLLPTVEFAIDDMQFFSPDPDPVVPPTVVAPIIDGDTAVTVTDFLVDADLVDLYRGPDIDNLTFVAEESIPAMAEEVVFDISAAPAVGGEIFVARQHDSVTGVWSDFSLPVEVLDGPAAYTLSLLIDDGGDTCSPYDGNGGWEFVPTTEVASGPPSLLGGAPPCTAPQGTPLYPNNAIWQTIEIPVGPTAPVTGWLAGDGDLDPNTVDGIYGIESLWFTSLGGTLGAQDQEILIDSVEALDINGDVVKLVHTMEDLANYFELIRYHASTTLGDSDVITTGSYDGVAAQRLTWNFPDDQLNHSLAVRHRLISACNTGPHFPDNTVTDTLRLRMHIRNPSTSDVPLPVVLGPIVGAQAGVIVQHDATATSFQMYINGDPAGSPITPDPGTTETEVLGLTIALGDSISAKQTLPDARGESDFAYPRASALPVPPTVESPIPADATTITVTGALNAPYAVATMVDLYLNGSLIDSAVPVDGTATFDVSGVTLVGEDIITATQTVNALTSLESEPVSVGFPAPPTPTVLSPIVAGEEVVTVDDVVSYAETIEILDEADAVIGSLTIVDLEDDFVDVPLDRPLVHLENIRARATNVTGSATSDPLEVGIGNSDVLISLGIRETDGAPPLGEPDGSGGSIEWIGASEAIGGAPIGQLVTPSYSWQTLVFDSAVDPMTGFTGNGAIDVTYGTIEHLAVAVDSTSPNRSTGPYTLYIDNVINVGADGGDDFTLADFEAFGLGEEVLFQEPTFSGSTSGNLSFPPSFSDTTDAYGNPGQSQLLSWFFTDTTEGTWVRLTTWQANNLAYPTIDLTKPIQMDVLLLPACLVEGDLNGDGMVTGADAAALMDCLSGPGNPLLDPTCNCGTISGDSDIDMADVYLMQQLFVAP